LGEITPFLLVNINICPNHFSVNFPHILPDIFPPLFKNAHFLHEIILRSEIEKGQPPNSQAVEASLNIPKKLGGKKGPGERWGKGEMR
jgi:hypothetical protein